MCLCLKAQKANEKFFKTIKGGFDSLSKVFFGSGLSLGGTLAGVSAIANQSTSINNLSTQQGIDPQRAQTWANIFHQANPELGKEAALNGIYGVQQIIAEQAKTGKHTGAFAQLGLNPAEQDEFKIFSAFREKGDTMRPDIFSNLIGEFGLSPAFTNAFHKDKFSDKEFEEAQNTITVSNENLAVNQKLASVLAKLDTTLGVITQDLLADIAPKAAKAGETFLKGNDQQTKDAAREAAISAGEIGIPATVLGGPIIGGLAAVGTFGYQLINKLGQSGELPHSIKESLKKRAKGFMDWNSEITGIPLKKRGSTKPKIPVSTQGSVFSKPKGVEYNVPDYDHLTDTDLIGDEKYGRTIDSVYGGIVNKGLEKGTTINNDITNNITVLHSDADGKQTAAAAERGTKAGLKTRFGNISIGH